MMGNTVPTALGQYAHVLLNAPPTASLEDVVELLVKTAPAMADTFRSRHVIEFLADEVENEEEQTAVDAITVLDALIEHTNQSFRFGAADGRWTVVTRAAAAGDERALRISELFFRQGETEYEQVIERHKRDLDSS